MNAPCYFGEELWGCDAMLIKPEEMQKHANFLNKSRAIAFIGCVSWGLGATLLSHFIVGLLF
jgi:hypothetical protein